MFRQSAFVYDHPEYGLDPYGTLPAAFNDPSDELPLNDEYVREASASEVIEKCVGGRFSLANRVVKNGAVSVYRVFSPRFRTEVAIKLVDRSEASAKHAVKFLQREMEISPLMQHPFVCRFLDVFWADEMTAVFLSEFYPGGSFLDIALATPAYSEYEKAVMFRQLCEAVQYVHSRNLMENILLDAFGNTKLADFGFARSMESRLCRSNSFCGTWPYSSPEIAWQREYDPFSNDWYSMGVVLYTLLSGMWPFKVECVTKQPPWPLISYPTRLFSQEAIELLKRLLQENAYLRADYEVVLKSPFLRKHQQGFGNLPIVRGPASSLFK